MLKKLTLFLASLAASLVLAGALALAGFVPGGSPGSTSATIAGGVSTGPEASPPPVVQVDTVYVAPPPTQTTITVHKVVHGAGESSGQDSQGD
jgi:hypothetical protein